MRYRLGVFSRRLGGVRCSRWTGRFFVALRMTVELCHTSGRLQFDFLAGSVNRASTFRPPRVVREQRLSAVARERQLVQVGAARGNA
jgi:hypothetical protein